MIINLFNTHKNTITYNIKLSKVIGVNSAIYVSELLNQMSEWDTSEEYFKVDRKDITNRTGIIEEEQLTFDKCLNSIDVLNINESDINEIKLNLEKLISIISDEDEDKIRKLFNKYNKGSKLKESLSKKQVIINKLKDGIVCSNSELLEALKGWVETIYSSPNGYLSKQIIQVFQETLNNYTQGDLDLALEIVKLATIHGYKDCAWAINLYEKEQSKKSTSSVRVTVQKKVSKLSDTIF